MSSAQFQTWKGFTIIALLLVGLAFIPPLLRKKEFSYAPDSAVSESKTFPISKSLPLVFNEGKKISVKNQKALEDYFGDRPSLIINFWATWCPPCIEELPSLEFLHRQLKSSAHKNLPQIVMISVDEEFSAIDQLLKTLETPLTLPIFLDKEGSLALSLGTTRFPETYWVDKSGNILHKWTGPQDWLSEDVLKKLSR